MFPAYDWNVKSQDKWRQLCFVSISWVSLPARHSRNILFCQTVLSDIYFLYPYYIYPHYPQKLGSASERKPQPQTLRIRNCYIYNPLHNCLWIFLNSYLSISISLRGGQPKHLSHPFRVFSEVLVLLGSIGRSQGWQMQLGACCGIQKARQNTVPRSLVGVGAWRAQVYWVDQAWRVSC